jgi:hypothetical protein
VAHCLRLAAPAGHHPFLVDLCTVDGVVQVDMSDPADSPAPHDAQAAGFCLSCHALPQVMLPAPIDLPAPRLAFHRIEAPPAPPVPALGARAPPYRPTGPPRLS